MPHDPSPIPLFGELAVELGFCDSAAVQDALSFQEEQRSLGLEPPLLGQILLSRGDLGLDEVLQIVKLTEERARAISVPGFADLEPVARSPRMLAVRAIHLDTQQRVTLKFLRFDPDEVDPGLASFRSDARNLARLEHPNVVRVLDAGDLEGIPFLVQEHFHGPDLRALVAETGGLDERRTLRILAGTAAGLEHAHTLGIVHGALRPESIVVHRIGGARVTDFAIPCQVEDRPVRRPRQPEFIAPEQIRPPGRVTPRTDAYSLGAVLFFMLTGRPPFRGTYRQVTRQHLRRPAPDPRVLVPSISEGTALLISLLLEKDAAARPASMTEVLKGVEQIEALGESLDAAADALSSRNRAAAPGRLRSRRRPGRLDR